MRHFVFCHGFGFDKSFWNNLAPYFTKEKTTFLDLENGDKVLPFAKKDNNSEKKIIGIGHSLGVLKLLKLYRNFDCIISLNGFVNFLGNDVQLRNKRHLELMLFKKHLVKDQASTLKAFYKRCGISPSFISQNLNVEHMLYDLELLTYKFTPPQFIPMLALTSTDDEIVPRNLVEDNFLPYSNVDIVVVPSGKHALGFLNEAYVYEKIMSFIDEKIIYCSSN